MTDAAGESAGAFRAGVRPWLVGVAGLAFAVAVRAGESEFYRVYGPGNPRVTAIESSGYLAWTGSTLAAACAVESTGEMTASNAWSTLSRATVTVAVMRTRLHRYLVIDLAGGPAAAQYPVAWRRRPPEDLLSNPAYKTTKLVLRRIPGGSFVMGSPTGEIGHVSSAETQHVVTITRDVLIGVFEVTQKQWERVAGTAPWQNAGETHPVERATWSQIRGGAWPGGIPASDSFLGRLRARTGLAFDLPTEAQWEYACRAGTTNSYHNDLPCLTKITAVDVNLDPLAWYVMNSGSPFAHQEVGLRTPNAWGLFDMHGNIEEYCLDQWIGGLTPAGGDDPVGSSGNPEYRLARGGSHLQPADQCRSAYRYGAWTPLTLNFIGFRAAAALP